MDARSFSVRAVFAAPLLRLLAATAMLVVAAGASGCNVERPVVESGTTPLVFDVLGLGQHAVLPDSLPFTVAVRDSAVWDTLAPDLRTFSPIGGVDFSQRMILVAAVPVEYGGHILTFQSVEADSTEIIATYMLTVPDDDCVTAMGLTTPFQAVAATRSDLPVRFVEERELISCDLG
jgi:hypothetical protein